MNENKSYNIGPAATVEKLAAYMHEVWSNLMQYLHDSRVFDLNDYPKWADQTNTPYYGLSEEDKEKDRKFAREILELIKMQVKRCGSCDEYATYDEESWCRRAARWNSREGHDTGNFLDENVEPFYTCMFTDEEDT